MMVDLDGRTPQQNPKVPPLARPEWGPAPLPSPWWEALPIPCAPDRAAEDSDSSLNHHPRATARGIRGQRSAEGGGHTMARIFRVLSALAALFLIAGASAKY